MLTHIDQNNLPTMVDITEKKVNLRMAEAQTLIQLPLVMKEYLKEGELTLKKGPVFQTAIVAGTMAVKKTYEIIPFCHQLPIESCKFDISLDKDLLVTITCKVKTTYKTGVEMEAIHGAMTAGLVIYDMCKAISHEIVIRETKLLSKTGGKRTILDRPVFGLVLTGGKSERMGTPKALLNYKGIPHGIYTYDVLSGHCDQVFISSKKNQWKGTSLEKLPSIIDVFENEGPIGGMLSAFEQYPDVNWLVVACDLPHFNSETVDFLLANINLNAVATAFKNKEKEFPEALCALYTTKARSVFQDAIKAEIRCPVKVLKKTFVELIEQQGSIDLTNVNTKEEFHALN